MFTCTAFYDDQKIDTKAWECSPEEWHRRQQAKYDELFGDKPQPVDLALKIPGSDPGHEG